MNTKFAIPFRRAEIDLDEATAALVTEDNVQALVLRRTAQHIPVMRQQLYLLLSQGSIFFITQAAPTMRATFPALRTWVGGDMFKTVVEDAVTCYIHTALYPVLGIDCFTDIEYIPLLATWVEKLIAKTMSESDFGHALVGDVVSLVGFAGNTSFASYHSRNEYYLNEIQALSSTALRLIDQGIKQIKEDWQLYLDTVEFMNKPPKVWNGIQI